METQSVDEFLDSILNDKGITDVEPDIREDLKEDMKKKLLDQINKAAVLQLSEEKAIELSQKVDDPNFTDEDVTKFLEDAGVNLAEVTVETMLRFREFYLGTGE